MIFSNWQLLAQTVGLWITVQKLFWVRISFFSPVNRNFNLTISNHNFLYCHLEIIMLKIISSSSFIHTSTKFQVLKAQVVFRLGNAELFQIAYFVAYLNHRFMDNSKQSLHGMLKSQIMNFNLYPWIVDKKSTNTLEFLSYFWMSKIGVNHYM